MRTEQDASVSGSRPGAILLGAVGFFYLTVILRTLAEAVALGAWLPIYLGLELLFGILYTLAMAKPLRPGLLSNGYLVFQSLLVLFLISLHPRLDFTNTLTVLLSYQVAQTYRGWKRWLWISILLALITIPLTVLLQAYGLALSLLPAAVAIVFSAYVAALQEIEAGQIRRQALLIELQEANRQLTEHAARVEALSKLQERNRLARELHDSVSQTMFSISLNSRAARILFERDPKQLQPQLEQLQELSRSALQEMRSLIADLRPVAGDTSKGPTP